MQNMDCSVLWVWGNEAEDTPPYELSFSPMCSASDAELLYPHVCNPPLDMLILLNEETKQGREIEHTTHQNSHNTHLLKAPKHFILNISNGIRYPLC